MREQAWTAGSLLQAMGNQCVRAGAGLLCLLLLLTLCAEPALAGKGKKYFREGRKAEQSNDFDTALVLYERAVREDPKQVQYLLAARRLRFLAAMTHVDRGHKLRDSGKLAEALKEFEGAFAIDPSSAIAEQELRRTLSMLEAQEGAPPPPAKPLTPREQAEAELQQRLDRVEGPVTLAPLSRAPITLKATNESKVLFETVGKLAGINVLLEPDFQSRRISIELNRVTLEQALDHLAVITKNLWKPLTSNTILVYAAAKRREQEPLVIKTFYLTNLIQPQEITELAQTIRNLLENNRVQQVNSQNAIIVRDTPDKVAIAEKLVNDIDKAKAEVVIDVAVLQMRRDRSREIGLFPGSPGLQIPVAFTPGSGTGVIPLSRLGKLGSNDWSIVLPGAALNLLLSEGGARLLQNPQVRAVDGQSAKLAIGERIPIATGSFSGIGGVAGAGISPLVSTQFQYIDVGVNLDITPKVHGNRDVSLKVKVEISAVTSRVNVGGLEQPIIGQRRVEQEIRLREGEMNILGGILETQETTSMAGIPGLSKIPVLKHFFSSTRKEVSENEVLIVMTPHIVRLPRMTAANLRGIDVGTSSNFRIRTRPATTERAPAAPGSSAAPAPPLAPLPGGPPDGAAPPASPEQSSEKPESPPATPPDPSPAEPPPDSEPGSATTPALPPRADVVETPSFLAASATTALRFGEAVYNQAVGSRFDVAVHIEQAQNIASLPLWLRYDPKLLKLVDVSHGDFLAPEGQLVTVAERVDHKTGMATVTLTREPGMQGVSGTGIVATLTFEAKTTGESRLNLLRTGARNPGQKTGQVRGARASVVVN